MNFEVKFIIDGFEVVVLSTDIPVKEDGVLDINKASELKVVEAQLSDDELAFLGRLFKTLVDAYYNEVIINGKRGKDSEDEGTQSEGVQFT